MNVQNYCRLDKLGQCSLVGSLISITPLLICFAIALPIRLRHPINISFYPDSLDYFAGDVAFLCYCLLWINSFTQPIFGLTSIISLFQTYQNKWISLLAIALVSIILYGLFLFNGWFPYNLISLWNWATHHNPN